MGHRIDTLSDEICAAAEAGAPLGWATITLEVWSNVMAWEVAVSAQGPDGLSVGEMRQLAITEKLQELRDEMCDADTGAWLSARFIVNRGRQREIIFNYDENPNWLPELHPLMWLRDLEAYPRAEQHVPQWLREMVALGLDLEHRHEPGEPA